MSNFSSSKILNNKDIIAKELSNARKESRKTLEDVSHDLGIRKEYLRALEDCAYDKLPQGVYGKNYLREYGRYLRLDEKKLLELYDEDFKDKAVVREKEVFSRKVLKAHLFLIVPKIVKNSLLFLAVLICLTYLGYYVNNIITPPDMEIFYPQKDMIVDQTSILVSGSTELEAEIIINNEKVLADKNGDFKKEINLHQGVNVINVSSQKKYSKKNMKVIKVLVEK